MTSNRKRTALVEVSLDVGTEFYGVVWSPGGSVDPQEHRILITDDLERALHRARNHPRRAAVFKMISLDLPPAPLETDEPNK